MGAKKVATLLVVFLVPLASQFPVQPRLKETGRSLPIVISQYSNVGIANRNIKNKSTGEASAEPKSLDVKNSPGEEPAIDGKNKQSAIDDEPSQSPKEDTPVDVSMNAADQGQQVDELVVDQVKETTAEETPTVNEPVAPTRETIADPLLSEQSTSEKISKTNEDKNETIETKKDTIDLAESLASTKTASGQEDEFKINEPTPVKNEKKEEKVGKDMVKEAQVGASEDPKASVTKHETKEHSSATEKGEAEIVANEGVDKEAVATKIDSKPKDKAVASFKESSKSSLQKALTKSETKLDKLKAKEAKGEEVKTTEAVTKEAKAEEAKTGEVKTTEAVTKEAKAGEDKAEEATAEEAKAEEAKAEEAKAEEAKAEEAKSEEHKAEEKSENEDMFDNQMLPSLTADELIEEDRSFKSSPEMLNLEAVQQRASTTGLDKKTLADLSQLDIIVDKTRLEEFNGAVQLESGEKRFDEKKLDEKKFDEKKEKDPKETKEKEKAKLLGKPIKETKPFKQAKLNAPLTSDDPVHEYEEPTREKRSQ